MKNFQCIILNSNPWFSAVSDYSLQLALFLKQQNIEPLYCAEVKHTHMDKKCINNQILFKNIPIYKLNFITFFISFFSILNLIIKNKNNLKFIFVFEGREHTLLGIIKFIFPFFFKKIKLIRIRGQAQNVRNRLLNRFLYNKISDQIVLAAEILESRFFFPINNLKLMTCHYGKTLDINSVKNKPDPFFIKLSETIPEIKFNKLTFFVLGRFDLVKGHDYFLNSYVNAQLTVDSQVIFLGIKEQISAQDLYEKYKPHFLVHVNDNSECFYLSSVEHKKSVFMIEKRLEDGVLDLINHSSFGVVPSLDSEVICRVVVEFLNCSVPVLYSTAGALPEVLNQFPELKFEKGDVKSLQNMLQKAQVIYQNEALYSQYKHKAHEVWQQNYQGNVYKKIVDFKQ